MSIKSSPLPEEMGLNPEDMELKTESADLIEDVEKARVMAEAGDESRTRAASSRKKYNDRSYHGSLRENFKQMLDYNERDADKLEDVAGKEYDLRKMVEGMGVESLTNLIDQATLAEGDISERLEQLRQELVKASEDSKATLHEQLTVTEKELGEVTLKVRLLNKILSERK